MSLLSAYAVRICSGSDLTHHPFEILTSCLSTAPKIISACELRQSVVLFAWGGGIQHLCLMWPDYVAGMAE